MKANIIVENNLKECIKELAKQRNENITATMEYICTTLGVTKGHIYNIIRGDRNPSLELQFAFAAIFNKKAEEIFFPRVLTDSIQIGAEARVQNRVEKNCDMSHD